MRQRGSRWAIESGRLDAIPDVPLTNTGPLNAHLIQEVLRASGKSFQNLNKVFIVNPSTVLDFLFYFDCGLRLFS